MVNYFIRRRTTSYHELRKIQEALDLLILGTPTSTLRIELTKININILEIMAKIDHMPKPGSSYDQGLNGKGSIPEQSDSETEES